MQAIHVATCWVSNNFCFVLQYILVYFTFGFWPIQPAALFSFCCCCCSFCCCLYTTFLSGRAWCVLESGWLPLAVAAGTDHVPLLVTALTVISVTQPAKGLLLCLTSSLSHFFALFSFNFACGLLVCASLLGSYFTYFAQIVCVCCVCCWCVRDLDMPLWLACPFA